MTTSETVAVAVALVVAAAAWAGMFLPDRRGVWTRTWLAAVALVATAIGCLVAVDRLGDVVGPVDAVEVAIGLAVGAAWLVATHIGFRIVAWVLPSFGDQVRDLYRLRDDGASTARMVGPVVAMGVAEELVFRGVVQGLAGFVVGLVAYTAVQAFEGKWALGLAAALGGAVWGALFAWRSGIVAPVAAHVLWTGVLTFLWPLGGEAPAEVRRRGSAPAARA